MQKKVLEIVKNISVDSGLPTEVIKAIVESQFQCAREATKTGEVGNPSTFNNIRFKHLGILFSRPYKILRLK